MHTDRRECSCEGRAFNHAQVLGARECVERGEGCGGHRRRRKGGEGFDENLGDSVKRAVVRTNPRGETLGCASVEAVTDTIAVGLGGVPKKEAGRLSAWSARVSACVFCVIFRVRAKLALARSTITLRS